MESSPEVSDRMEALRLVAPITRRELWCRDKLRDQEVVLLCGTLGVEFDLWQRRLSAVSSADAYLAQRIGLEEIEKVMDGIEDKIRVELKKEGKTINPRRSPGYGDLPLELSREILMKTDATKKIGVSMTDSNLLVPSKSVTAICEIVSEKAN